MARVCHHSTRLVVIVELDITHPIKLLFVQVGLEPNLDVTVQLLLKFEFGVRRLFQLLFKIELDVFAVAKALLKLEFDPPGAALLGTLSKVVS